MGFKFRKQIKIAPGVKLNIGKEGASVSVGAKGFTQTYSTTGKTTTTVGVPGTGLSYSSTNSPKKESSAKEKSESVKVRDMDHLDENGNLPIGWTSANRHLTQPVELIFTYLRERYTEEKKNGVLAKYASLKAFVLYMDDMHESCAAKGECFLRWSYDLASPSYLESYKQDLGFMERNMEMLLQNEKNLLKLKQDLLEIINAEPGVIQSDIYNRFDPDFKPEISNQLYLLSADGTITREKNGRSYKLYIKQEKAGE